MARTTTNYGLNISEGTDLVNPLTDIFPNFETLDSDLKDVSDSAVGSATELLTGTVHALTRADSDRNIFTFTATSNFEAGETFTLDGVQVTALTPDGQTLSTGCYIIGSEVLCAVKGTLVTFYVNPSKALDSDKLDGHDSSYFATDSDLDAVAQDVSDISDKVGTGVLTTTAQDCIGGINEVNSKLTASGFGTSVTLNNNITWQATDDGYVTFGCGFGASDYCNLSLNSTIVAKVASATGIANSPTQCLTVRKGMMVRFEGSATAFATFLPLA